MNTTRFCLVRHGETDWNVARRLQGHTDIALNARGHAQAMQLALALKKSNLQFDVLYTSDLQRYDVDREQAHRVGNLAGDFLAQLPKSEFESRSDNIALLCTPRFRC